ncbi:MAG: SDR family NAD(P)-dependent oxidoreductase [Thermoplasmatota archaeon]
MSQRFQGKVALVTGGASGIGLATAHEFAREAASVVVADISQEAIDKAVAEIHELDGKAIGVVADVSKEDDIKAMVAKAEAEFGGLDIIVNNAGIGGPAGLVEDYPVDGWQKVLDINLTGVFLGMKYALPAIQRRGGGAIVNVSSILGFAGFATSSAYVAAKHGVIGLTRAAALEYAPKSVRVNAVSPGFIETPLIEDAGIKKGTEIHDFLVSQHPIGRLGTAEEIAHAIVWLASDDAKFVNGHALVADGGYLAR